MTKEINRTNKIQIENERIYDLDLDSTFSMESLYLNLILQLDEKISDVQARIAICEKNVEVCDLDIGEWEAHMQEEGAIKKEASELCQKFLSITKNRKIGCYFPESPDEIAVKYRFIRKTDKFTLLPGSQNFPAVLEANTIYLQVDLKKNVLFCMLYNDQNKIVRADIALNGLWCIDQNCSSPGWHQALQKLLIGKSPGIRINILESLAKQGCISNPYFTTLQLFQKRIIELERSIRETQLLIREKESVKTENIAQKEKFETELVTTQQQLMAITALLGSTFPHQTSANQTWVGTDLKKQNYQLQVVPAPALSNLFARRRRGHGDRDEQSDTANKYAVRQFRKS